MTKVQTIQKTGKGLKAYYIFSFFMLIVSIFVLFYCTVTLSDTNLDVWFCVANMINLGLSRFLIWWSHG